MSLRRLNDRIGRALMALGALWAFGLAIYILIDVLARAAQLKGIPGTAEIARNSIITIVFLQIAYCVQHRGMLQVDFLVGVLPRRLQRAMSVFGYVLGFMFFMAICVGSWGPALAAFSSGTFEGEGALRVPVWPARFAIVIGCFLAATSYLVLLWEHLFEEGRDTTAGTNDVPPAI
jgi:TRAP-type C4-dicarboxylate transport system permease small subunit